MAYSDSVKIRAYSLFLQGYSFEDTAKSLRGEFGVNVSPTTVRNWAEKPGKDGLTWDDQRAKVRAVAHRNVELAERTRIEQMREKAELIQEKLYNQMMGKKAPKVGSFDGGVYAFKALAEFIIKTDEKAKGDVSTLAVVQTMLGIFWEIPEVRKALQRHWPRVEKAIKERIMGYEAEEEPRQLS